MNKAGKLLLILALLGLYAVAPALADVPTKMNVQGRLTNGSGGVVPAGLKNFTFKIFDQQVGGIEIWPAAPGETQTLVTDANGLWSGSIGQLIPLTEAVFQSPVRWLEVTVNDGVNPPETLPRVELKTNPYTYRAATSQQADSLAGNSLSDLTNQFVNVSGDVMTGRLSNTWVHKNLGTGMQVDNPNDAWGSWWNDETYGTWGLSADVSGDGNYWNIGVAAVARGNNNVSEANRGVLAYVEGTGSVNVGVEASTGMNGTANYSGYFQNGDFTITNPQTPGTGGVQLPADAVDHTEIFDGPGIASDNNPVFVDQQITGSMSDVETVTITTPADGYIHVQGNVYSWITGAAGDAAVGVFQIDESPGGGSIAPYYRAVGSYSKSASNSFHPVTVERTYFKPAGTYTFRIEGVTTGITGSGALWTIWPILTATYCPEAYGSVAALATSVDANEFQDADPVSAVTGAGGTEGTPVQSEQTFKVDLRELELKAAKTQAEAEKARRELVEARASVSVRSSQAATVNGEGSNR